MTKLSKSQADKEKEIAKKLARPSYTDYGVDTIQAALRQKAVLRLIKDEIKAARAKHQPFNSWHEAHSVIQEEFEEFWDSVKEDDTDIAELVSVAAMAILAIMELDGQTDKYGKRTEWPNT